jgi:hypothetical protein
VDPKEKLKEVCCKATNVVGLYRQLIGNAQVRLLGLVVNNTNPSLLLLRTDATKLCVLRGKYYRYNFNYCGFDHTSAYRVDFKRGGVIKKTLARPGVF